MDRRSVRASLALIYLAAVMVAPAQSLNILGGLSNFDVWNDDLNDACGFEIELHGVDSSAVRYTYNWSAFGAPTVTSTTFGGQPGTLVRYYSDTTTVAPHSYTHFGVTLNHQFDQNSLVRKWLYRQSNNVIIRENVVLPEWHSELVTLPDGSQAVRDGVFNPAPDVDGSPIFFVDIYNHSAEREVGLDELMQDDPTFTGATFWGREQLDPQNFWYDDDIVPEGSGLRTDIFSYKVYASMDVNGTPEADESRLLAVIMNGTVTAVPEPGTMVVIGLGVAAFAARRRRKSA